MSNKEKIKVRNQGKIIALTIFISITIMLGSVYVFFGDQILKKENKVEEKVDTVALNSWAVVSKFNEKTNLNENVSVKITKVTLGEEAEKIIKKYAEENKFIEYKEVEEKMQAVVVEYEIDFKEYTKNKFGDTVKLEGAVLNALGESVETEDSIYPNIPIRNISKEEKVDLSKNGSGSFAFQIPLDATDIVLKIGDEKGTTKLFNIF